MKPSTVLLITIAFTSVCLPATSNRILAGIKSFLANDQDGSLAKIGSQSMHPMLANDARFSGVGFPFRSYGEFIKSLYNGRRRKRSVAAGSRPIDQLLSVPDFNEERTRAKRYNMKESYPSAVANM